MTTGCRPRTILLWSLIFKKWKMNRIDLISRMVGTDNSLNDCADLPLHHRRTMSGHLTRENTEGSDGHLTSCRPEISETVDIPDLHRVWLLYYTHLTTHTHTHTVTLIFCSDSLLCASSPDLWRSHLSFLGNGDSTVPDSSLSHSLWHFPAFLASTDCLYQHLLWGRQPTHSQGPLRQWWVIQNGVN